jgi:glycosyltransferase involved in cell wall biosynthesis
MPSAHKVAHIIAPGPMAGAEQIVLGGAAALHARGALHSLIVIDEARAGNPGAQLAALASAQDLPVHTITTHRRLDLAMISALDDATAGATILHAHGTKPLLYAHAVAHNRPLVATHHGDLFRTNAERSYALLQRALYGAIDAVCCVSEAQRLQLSRTTPYARCAVIENFARIAPRRDPATALPDAPFWLFAGRLSQEKGLDVLLSALAAADVHTPLLVAGDGDDAIALHALAHQLGLTPDRVRFLGWRDDVPALIAAAAALIMPSRREGMPLSALEARAAGVPILASMVGGIPEIASHGDGALLVPPEDVEALASALQRLERDGDALRARARDLAPEARRRFSPDTWADRTISLYDALR